MRTVIRIIISIVAGFALMWPLGYVCSFLNLPTFHSWGLIHGSFFSAWPTLSILIYLSLGYASAFSRVEDTPLLIAGLVWGLILACFVGFGSLPRPVTLYALLIVTTAIIAVLGFFAKLSLRLALLTVSPMLFFALGIIPVLTSQPTLDTLRFGAAAVALIAKNPLLFAIAGWALARLAKAAASRLLRPA